MPPRLHSPGTAAYTAKQGRFSLTSGERCSLCQRHRNSALGGMRISSLCPSALGPQKVGVGASPQKAFGLPHPWVGKTCLSPDRASTDGSLSALRGRFGIILLLIPSPGSEPRASETSSTKARTAAQIRPVLAGRGRETTPSQHRTTQRPTGGHEGFSCFCRSFATRWRSVASSSSASWLA